MIRPPCASLLIVACALALSGCAGFFSSPPRFVNVTDTPKLAGANAAGVAYGGLLYTAGFTPRDPQTGAIVRGGIAAQTHRVLDNLESVLKRSGCTLGDVVKVDVFVADYDDIGRVNAIVAARFGGHKPESSAVSVSRLQGPGLLEADFVARLR